MTDGSAGDALAERFAALVAAAGGADRPDWLATATDAAVRRRLDDLAAAVTDGTDATPAAAYQARLGDEERATTGHFRTHPGIAAALCRWAVRPRADGRLPRVLDPAVGSGVFTATAVDRLAALAPDATPADRLARVVGVDVDPVPLALTARRLLARADDAPRLHLYESDFFDVEPGDCESVTVTGDGLAAGRFDAVVGNPPYVRQETVDADRAREHLAAFGPDGAAPYRDGDRALSRRSDAYVYFVTHATRFLREGGRLGVVVPAKWLTTRYGTPFQRFLFDHYRLHAVVGFGTRAFDDALVDTVLLLAERCDDAARRRETPVRFCRLDEQVSVATLHGCVDEAPDPTGDELAVANTDRGRTVAVRQGALADREATKLAPYLDAPAPVIRLLADDALAPLGDLGTVRRGVMTGANDFFFLAGDGRAADVDDRFLAPAIKSIRDVDDRVVTAADTDRYLLDVHDYVAGVRDEHTAVEGGDAGTGTGTGTRGDPLETAVKRALDRDGYDGLREYVAWGEREGFDERRSCAARTVWFDLGEWSPPAVFVPKFFDERVLAVANPDGLLAGNAVDCLWLADGVAERPLLGILNATVTKALLEAWGRSEGGGALQVMTYELATLPVPDPRGFDPGTRRAVADATDALLAGDDDARDRLDRLVVDAVGTDLSVERCRRLRDRMVDRRVRTGDRAVAPIVVD